jgi:Protein of unknown function (DUF2793)
MASSTEPRSGIKYGWALGESGWKTEMDANLLLIGRVGFQLSVIDRSLTAPPGSPVAGDCYIVGPAPTGSWSGKVDNITIYDGSSWVFYPPRHGYLAYIEDEDKLTVYKADSNAGWSSGVAI